MKKTQARTLPKSLLAGALGYALNQEREIYRILESGDYELDNNSIERQMRPIAVGRKNYMFAGSHDGAYRAAVLYSLLSTCKLNKINPWERLRNVLMRIKDQPVNRISELLPHRWRMPA